MVDGDTVEVERLGRTRLIGVDTPEKGCGDDAATRFTRKRLLNKIVRYELGEEPKDRYDRTLAYLSREGQMHNLALVSEGYARVLTIPPNDKYASEFEEAEGEAKPTAGSLESCDRNRRRAVARRKREEEKARGAAALRRERARGARRAARAEARREGRRARAAARRGEQEAREEEFGEAEEDSGGSGRSGGGGSCLPSSACPGKRDGDGDGCYCE